MERRVQSGGEDTRKALASLNDQLAGFVQESPLMAIGGAFAVGYVIAKMARAFK
jgi:hypothetical protein